MRELWLVAQEEYRTRIRQRSFLLGILAVPLLIVVSTGVAIAVSLGGRDGRPLGYVDQSGVLAAAVQPAPEEGEEPLVVRALADPAAAQAALESGEIQAYYVLPPDYLQSRQVALYYLDKRPGASTQNDFSRFIRANLLAGEPLGQRDWALEGPELVIRSADGARDWSLSNIVNVIVPFAAGFFFFFIVMGSSSYMMEAVTDEKENRTIEIMATSMTPEQLIGGKALGLMGVALTQMAIWVAAAAAALLVAAPQVPILANFQVPWGLVAIFGLYLLPAFALVCGMMIAVGGIVPDHRQGQQVAGVLNMLFTLPALLSALVFINPDSPVLVVLTFFPTTAMLTIMLRWGLTIIPLWQLAVSWLLLAATAGLSVWGAARIFRLGMLRYGQALNLRETLAGLRLRRGRFQ
jgi:ABC-2 type transport system permease protein